MSAISKSARSLWGELPDVSPMQPPVVILNEQGQILEKATDGLLIARARVGQEKGPARIEEGFIVTMDIVATALDNYTYQVLTVRHGISLYPARVYWGSEPGVSSISGIQCSDQQAFEDTVAKALQSDEVRRVITGLLTQMRYNGASTA